MHDTKSVYLKKKLRISMCLRKLKIKEKKSDNDVIIW